MCVMDNVIQTEIKFQIMPLSFAGFGPAAILIMLLTVVVSGLYKKYKKHRHHH
jgi:hypothetical protein